MFLLAINHKEDIATVLPTGDHSLIGLTFNCHCTFIAKTFNTLADIKQYVNLYYPECSISLELFDDTQVKVMQQCPDLSVSERDQIVETLENKESQIPVSAYKQGYQAGSKFAEKTCPKNFKGSAKLQWEKGYKLGLTVAKKKSSV